MSTILTPETEAALDRIAARSGRSREQLANDALQGYVSWFEHEEQKVAEARAAIDRGDFIEHDQFFNELESRYSG
jgi:predicted transcriptional regulator